MTRTFLPQLLPGEQIASLLYLPLYHSAGLIGGVFRGLATNSKLIILDRFRPEIFLAGIEKYKVSAWLIIALSKKDPHSPKISSVKFKILSKSISITNYKIHFKNVFQSLLQLLQVRG